MKKTLLAISALAFLATGTSCAKVLIPYDADPLCSKGKTGGYCGPITDVYEEVSRQEAEKQALEKIKTKNQKSQPYSTAKERSYLQ